MQEVPHISFVSKRLDTNLQQEGCSFWQYEETCEPQVHLVSCIRPASYTYDKPVGTHYAGS